MVHSTISKPLLPLIQEIERKSWLKLLGKIFQENPSDWNLHVDNLLRKANSRLYIFRVCKSLNYVAFIHGIEIWGAAYQLKYLDRIDSFFLSERLDLVTPTTCM